MKKSFFTMPGDDNVCREWVYELRIPIPIWVFRKWHDIDESGVKHHTDGRKLYPGDKLIFEKGVFTIERKK